MRVAELCQALGLLDDTQQKYWMVRFTVSMKPGFKLPEDVSFEKYILALYTKIYGLTAKSIIAYGAGNIGKKHIPQLRKSVDIQEVWDMNSSNDCLYDIPVVRPHTDSKNLFTPIVIFIENSVTVRSIMSELKSKGHLQTHTYEEYFELVDAIQSFSGIEHYITVETEKLMSAFINQFGSVEGDFVPVNYSVIPVSVTSVELNLNLSHKSKQALMERLFDILVVSEDTVNRIQSATTFFFDASINNQYDFAVQFELYLQKMLKGGLKTKERPIRMSDDTPYDQFSVYEVVKETLACICSDNETAFAVLTLLRSLSPVSVPLMAAECFFMLQNQQYEEALELSREAMRKEPNGLLANEIFYQTAIQCKKQGIVVKEPLPDYDLAERYCWSGLDFALCSGFCADGTADFLPCFRTHQCAAHPSGAFWSSEEWAEFRKSILDGSFRYCQKNQCSNIVAGWLPKKTECTHAAVNELIDGNYTKAPPLEELHFSYDTHCNLQCPSCRLEIKTNCAEQTKQLDELFEKNLRPLLADAKHLCLSGCGEAIISPHGKKVLQSFSAEKYPNLSVELRTNVFSFTPMNWSALGSGREVIKHVAASIDAASKDLFEKLRFPAKWNVVQKNLRFLQSLRNANEIELLEFHVVVQSDNIEELMDIVKMAMDYDADVITFSRMVNWRKMSEQEYHRLNPFWTNHPKHERLMRVIDEIIAFRDTIESETAETDMKKKLRINMHCVPDPNSNYDLIRTGKLKIR